MTLDEAIKIITDGLNGVTTIPFEDWGKALKLGREASLRLQNLRILFPTMNADLLPGETKE